MTTHARPGPALSDIGAEPRLDGRSWVFPSGYRCPVVAGGSGGQGAAGDAVVDPPAGGTGGGNPPAGTGDPAAGGTGPAGQGASGAGAGAGLTQADLDRASADAKKAAAAELAEALGVPLAEAKKIIADRRAADDAQKTEAQRATEAAQERERQADARERSAAARERAADLRSALVEAKVKGDRSANAAKLILADLADDADGAAIAAAVKKFAEDTPEWFGDAGPPPPPGSDPAGRGPAGGQGGQKTGIEAGRERARAAKATAHAGANGAAPEPFSSFPPIGR